jgi:hypothetical protein
MTDIFSNLQSAAHAGAFGLGSTAEPTPEQIRAGNYAKGSTQLHGMRITIETPMHQPRRGKSDGKAWSITCMAHYGYVNGTKGADGDAVDIYVGPAPESQAVYVVNQNAADGSFDEHKVMLGFMDEEQARNAYMNSYERGWQGLGSMTACTVTQFKYWLKHGDLSQPLSADLPNIPKDETLSMTDVFARWGADNLPVDTTVADLLYELRRNDADSLMMDSATMDDIAQELSDDGMLDAMVIEYKQFDRKASQLLRVMQNVGGDVKAESVDVSKPFKSRGTTQVGMLFSMDDGQSVSVFFHNPDSTPNKLMASDELISWKWVLNKRDITATVAPERGQDLNPRIVARRIMALVQKNSAKFGKANENKAADDAALAEAKAAVDSKTAQLADLDAQIVDLTAQLEKKKATPPGGEPGLFPEPPPPEDTRDDLAKFTDGLKAGDIDAALKVIEGIDSQDDLRELLTKAGFKLDAAAVTKAEIMADVGGALVRAAKAGTDGAGLAAVDAKAEADAKALADQQQTAPEVPEPAPVLLRPAWDEAFIQTLAELLEASDGDAQAVAMTQEALTGQLFADGKTPQEAAEAVRQAATSEPETDQPPPQPEAVQPPPDPTEDEQVQKAKEYLDSIIEGSTDLGAPADVLKEMERIYAAYGEGELRELFIEASDAYATYALKATAGTF